MPAPATAIFAPVIQLTTLVHSPIFHPKPFALHAIRPRQDIRASAVPQLQNPVPCAPNTTGMISVPPPRKMLASRRDANLNQTALRNQNHVSKRPESKSQHRQHTLTDVHENKQSEIPEYRQN